MRWCVARANHINTAIKPAYYIMIITVICIKFGDKILETGKQIVKLKRINVMIKCMSSTITKELFYDFLIAYFCSLSVNSIKQILRTCAKRFFFQIMELSLKFKSITLFFPNFE